MKACFAYDRVGSVRTFDEDGRLHIEATPISKANICSYLGSEIPNSNALGLQPHERYRLYRDANELKKAALTFNRLPVLETHEEVSASDPKRELVIGATGEAAEFKAPYLSNSMVIWDGSAIERIKAGTQRELSACYAYDPDMTPGDIDGEPYDGRMTNIRGNHIALVIDGRAGPDVRVADSADNLKKEPEMADNDRKEDTQDDEKAKDGLEEGLRALLGANASDDVIDSVLKIVNGAQGKVEDDAPSPQAVDLPPSPPTTSVPPPSPPVTEQRPARDDGEEKKYSEADVNRMIEDKIRANDARRTAMDSAIRDVRPLVGEVYGMDSAEAVYSYALKQVGIEPKGINAAGLRALVQTKLEAAHPASSMRAMDAAPFDFGVPAPRKIGG